MKISTITAVLLLLVTVLLQDSNAHHSVFAEYDINGSVTIEGVVTEIWFKSPHIRVFVEVTGDDGSKVTWNTLHSRPCPARGSAGLRPAWRWR